MFSGDGTYNEVINGLRADIPVGFVPGGGTSVLPRALGLPRDPARAAAAHRARARRGGSRSAASTAARSRSTRASGSTRSSCAGSTRSGRRADGKRPGDLAFGWTVVRTLADHRFRYEPALEIEGLGRAAFALVANCSPYTYAGRARPALRPRRLLRGRPRHRRADRGSRARGAASRRRRRCADGRAPRDVLVGHDLDRIVIRCDVPLPVQVDGEDIGDVEEAEIVAERDALTVLT